MRHSGRQSSWGTSPVRALLILVPLVLPGMAEAVHHVLAVQNVLASPYAEALEGFVSTCKCDVTTLLLSDHDERDAAREVRTHKPKLILALGNEAVAKVKGIRDIPIVYVMAPHTSPPQANLTGVSVYVPPEKYLEVFQEVIPQIRRIGVIYNPAKNAAFVERARRAAKSSGIHLIAREVDRPGNVPKTLKEIGKEIEALWIIPDTILINRDTLDYFTWFSIDGGIPLLTFSGKYPELGALLSVSVDVHDLGRQAGEMAKRILSGAAVSSVVPADPRRIVLTINQKVAQKLGLPISPEVLGKSRSVE